MNIPVEIIQHVNRITKLNNEHKIINDDLIFGFVEAMGRYNIKLAISYAMVIMDMTNIIGRTFSALDVGAQVNLRTSSILKRLRILDAEQN